MNIDLHTHVIPPNLVEAMERQPERYGTRIEAKDGKRYFSVLGPLAELTPEYYDADAKVEWMDRVGLDVSVMVAKRPERLRGMAHLPLQDPDAAIVELERVVKAYGFKGVELATSVEGATLAHPKFRKVLKTIEQLGCFVFAHPYQCVAKGGMEDYYLTNFAGFPLDTTLMVAHLMFSGALEELTQLRIVLAHGGGYIPYQIGRLVHGHRVRPEPKRITQTSPRELLRRFYFDALTHDPRATRHLINAVGATSARTVGSKNRPPRECRCPPTTTRAPLLSAS